jgi:hypothetical protein
MSGLLMKLGEKWASIGGTLPRWDKHVESRVGNIVVELGTCIEILLLLRDLQG